MNMHRMTQNLGPAPLVSALMIFWASAGIPVGAIEPRLVVESFRQSRLSIENGEVIYNVSRFSSGREKDLGELKIEWSGDRFRAIWQYSDQSAGNEPVRAVCVRNYQNILTNDGDVGLKSSIQGASTSTLGFDPRLLGATGANSPEKLASQRLLNLFSVEPPSTVDVSLSDAAISLRSGTPSGRVIICDFERSEPHRLLMYQYIPTFQWRSTYSSDDVLPTTVEKWQRPGPSGDYTLESRYAVKSIHLDHEPAESAFEYTGMLLSIGTPVLDATGGGKGASKPILGYWNGFELVPDQQEAYRTAKVELTTANDERIPPLFLLAGGVIILAMVAIYRRRRKMRNL